MSYRQRFCCIKMSYRQRFCCIKMSYRQIRTLKFLLKAPLKKSYKTSIWFFRFIFLLCLSIMTFIYLWVKNKEFLFGRVVCLLWQRKHQLKKYNKNFHIPFFFFKNAKYEYWSLFFVISLFCPDFHEIGFINHCAPVGIRLA